MFITIMKLTSFIDNRYGTSPCKHHRIPRDIHFLSLKTWTQNEQNKMKITQIQLNLFEENESII